MPNQLPALIDVKVLPVMNLEDAKAHLKQLKEFVHFYLEEGIDKDYGVIPGTPKPTLLKSGAQKLSDIYGLRPIFEILEQREDWDRKLEGQLAPLFVYKVLCRLVRKGDGLEMAQAIGIANSYEEKYLWRTQAKSCPECGSAALARSKAEWGGGWYCSDKKGGCAASWKAVATSKHSPSDEETAMVERINQQPTGRAVNENLFSVQNTILQMAQKRAMVPAVISATRSSQLFTMDLEDSQEVRDPIASDAKRTEFIEESGKLGWHVKDIQPYLTTTFGLPTGKIKDNITVSMCDKALIHFRNNPITDATEVKASDPKPATNRNKPKPEKPPKDAKGTTSDSQTMTSPVGTAAKESENSTTCNQSEQPSNAPNDVDATIDEGDGPDFSSSFN